LILKTNGIPENLAQAQAIIERAFTRVPGHPDYYGGLLYAQTLVSAHRLRINEKLQSNRLGPASRKRYEREKEYLMRKHEKIQELLDEYKLGQIEKKKAEDPQAILEKIQQVFAIWKGNPGATS